MTITYVSRVQTNAKQGLDIKLGPKTLLVGKNGSGKSTVIQAIELACTGGVSDIEGRDHVKQKGALLRLFGDQSTKPYVSLVLSNGQPIDWSPDSGDSSVVHFDYAEIKDLMRGDTKTIKAWVSQVALGALTEAELLSVLVPEQRKEVQALIRRDRLDADFSVVAAAAKKESTALKRKATTEEKTIEPIAASVVHPATLILREKVKAEIAELKQQVENRERDTLAAQLAQALMTVETQTRLFDKHKGIADELSEKLTNLDKVIPGSLEQYFNGGKEQVLQSASIMKLQNLLYVYIENFSTESCQLCGNENPDFMSVAGTLSTQINQISVLADVHVRCEKLIQAHNDLAAVAKELDSAKLNKKTLEDRLTALPQVDYSANLTKIQEKTEWLTKQNSNDKIYQQVMATKANIVATRAKAQILSDAASELDSAGTTHLTRNLSKFLARLSELCAGEDVTVDLDTGRFGFVRDGVVHTALCGGEWSTLLMALATIQVERAQRQGQNHSTLHLVAPDDRGWDVDTLAQVMASTKDVPVQIVLMTTNPAASVRPVDGWTIVYL
jgi:DNA repair exonuclease SbcCD ATPase subunit